MHVAERPAQPLGDHQDHRLGEDQGEAVAEAVGGGEQAELVGVGGDLDPPGVHRRVLGRRAETPASRPEATSEPSWVLRIACTPCRSGPPPTPTWVSSIQLRRRPSATEQRRLDPVDHRAPDELDRVGQADPGQEADRGQLDAVARPARTPSVLPISMNGRPDERPSTSISPTLGRDSAARTSCGRRRAGGSGGAAGAPFREMASGMARTLACVGAAVQRSREDQISRRDQRPGRDQKRGRAGSVRLQGPCMVTPSAWLWKKYIPDTRST